MGAAPIGAGGLNLQSGGFSSDNGGSRSRIENNINRLERQRDDYLELKKKDDSPWLEDKLGEVEKRLNNLKTRLEKVKAAEEEEQKDDGKCETCENRKYQDGSNDPGVSFKMASKVGPEGAEAAVRGHENEHVTRNQAKAAREGKEIVYQSVSIKRAICPECGRSYVAGGETKTVTRTKPERRFDVGVAGAEKGKVMDLTA